MHYECLERRIFIVMAYYLSLQQNKFNFTLNNYNHQWWASIHWLLKIREKYTFYTIGNERFSDCFEGTYHFSNNKILEGLATHIYIRQLCTVCDYNTMDPHCHFNVGRSSAIPIRLGEGLKFSDRRAIPYKNCEHAPIRFGEDTGKHRQNK